MAEKKLSKELQAVTNLITKEFGEGAIMSMGEFSAQNIEGIPTGSLGLDIALGGKGLPRGRVVEIYGNESSGKTTIALHAVANAQKAGGVAAFIDAEHALDPTWAKKIGVDLESLLVSQPSYGEEALRIAEMLVKSNAVDVIVIDSVAALVPKNELNNDIGDPSVGVQARLMSQALRVLNPAINKTRTCMIFINQIRQKIGVMYGNPETTTGGLALKFYASVRLEVRRAAAIKDGDVTMGSETKVKVVKNKIAPPFRTAEFELMHDRGIDYEGDLLKLAEEDDVVRKSGAFFSYGDVRLGQGKENAKNYLRDNTAVRDEIVKGVLAKRRPPMLFPANAASEEAPQAEELEPVEAPAPKKRGKAME
ncbi:MAG TPA: recombinase RecA [Fimbriiglobus sp.]|jgi:recombination protein RecA